MFLAKGGKIKTNSLNLWKGIIKTYKINNLFMKKICVKIAPGIVRVYFMC